MAVDLTGYVVLGFRIEALIGEGGMATVWLARHETLGKIVAIKALDPLLARDGKLVQRFVDEAKIQCNLRHPGIIAIENFSQDPLAILMEYVDGRSLSEMIGKVVGPIPFDQAQPLMLQTLAAVGYAHQQGVIHRDLKPANILVTSAGTIKVVDFGIAKILGGSKLTQTGATMGTAAYMAPEQIKGAKNVDRRSDIYSLGATFYEMLAGRTPFESDADTENDFEIRTAHVQQAPPDPRQFYPAIPEGAVEVLLQALAKDPAQRFQSAEEMMADLESVSGGGVVRATAPPIPAQVTSPALVPQTVVETPIQPPIEPPDHDITGFKKRSIRNIILLAVGISVVLVGIILGLVLTDKSSSPKVPILAQAKVVPSANEKPASPAPAKDAGLQWVTIPSGSFNMGSNTGSKSMRPVHPVQVRTFLMSKTEVTVGQYRACVKAGSCSQPHWDDGSCYIWTGNAYEKGQGPASFRSNNHPVVCVDWHQARKFCRWIGGRLPSEAEWEYAACSGGKAWNYPWGNKKATCIHAVMDEGGNGCGKNRTWPVCSKQAGNTLQGLCDLSGNVFEWVEDCYHRNYSDAPRDGSSWTSGKCSHRVLRGGSWYGYVGNLRTAGRYRSHPEKRNHGNGFRCARTMK